MRKGCGPTHRRVVARQAGKVQGCVAVSRLVRAGVTGQVRTRLGVRVRVRARARARARLRLTASAVTAASALLALEVPTCSSVLSTLRKTKGVTPCLVVTGHE